MKYFRMNITMIMIITAIMGQAYCTEDDQNPSTDRREDTHDHGTDDETGVGVLATADTETARDDEEYRAPYSSPKHSKMKSVCKYQECNVRETSSNPTENMYCPND